tara:strand:- start:1272 stop:1409 length:138 start_codon:yes stop_codon:yes gene_type:complete
MFRFPEFDDSDFPAQIMIRGKGIADGGAPERKHSEQNGAERKGHG